MGSKNNISPKDQINQAGENFKEAGKLLRSGTKNTINAGNNKIGSKIPNSKYKIINKTKNNIITLLLIGSVATYSGAKIVEKIKDNHKDEKENVINDNEIISHEYRDNNPDFFKKDYEPVRDSTYYDKGILLIRDVGMTFYVVKEGDNLTKIRRKLGQLKEFSYLQEDDYKIPSSGRNIKSFNVPSSSLKPNLYIPIPLDNEVRDFTINEFKQYCDQAIDEMLKDKNYGKDMKELLSEVNREDLITSMVAFARCESAQDHTNFSDNIGSVTFHRREPHMKSFSFSPYHILMEKNADGKTYGPGLKARIKLGLSEGQCYHPKNASMLFLAYWIEKSKGKPENYFPITKDNYTKVGKTYNGSSSYGGKLRDNINYIENYGKFVYERKSSEGKEVYSFICDKDATYKEIMTEFSKKHDKDPKTTIICRADGSAYSDDKMFTEGMKVFLK